MVKRILVLDDNQDILEVVHETLTYENFEVKSITRGIDVMPLVEEFNPDLVILDYRVAGANGGEICQAIKAHPKFGDVPVIIFSAYVNHSADLFAYGCDAIINKPFDLTELVEKVNGLIKN
ncbi:response regulator [Mucilaginibacter achroorhodeus]|uniref:Response regulator n=1 Tax=Mucilaginibacter achroorhodeus TaxID=2599294 RepID=A0A563TZR5_9SPHI|nr:MULTISPECIES: response regulator [Mucilaginibacter]QXV65707.1 response regulator [Mucilaginibacter sp. 21P]TWR24866.1 response regulator [Mucilaginibacter achroorhodeus]